MGYCVRQTAIGNDPLARAGDYRQQQLINLWERENQVITSIDYAKQPEVRERVWGQRWDRVAIDEAHKCSAYTKRRTGRADDVDKTRRYQLAERLTALADHVLLLMATPHHGDDGRFGHFLRLLDPDIFPEPPRYGDRARQVRQSVLSLGRGLALGHAPSEREPA
jgi:hypothetical protein